MNNFYGGKNGYSFDIRWIFSTKYGAGNSMEADLNMGWTSPISIGSFVVISYGLPSDNTYEDLMHQDLELGGKNYNSTLWQKIYDEDKDTFNGFDYKLVMSMSGNTPRIEFTKPITVLDADEEPDIIIDSSEVDRPKITLCLPQSQVLSMNQPITVLDADKSPQVLYDETDINRPVLTFRLPQSQVLDRAVIEEYLDVGQQPEVRLDFLVDGTINRPVLKFKLPVAQQFLDENISHVVLDADKEPFITFDDTDVNNPKLVFHLPRSQVMDDPNTVVVDPLVKPSVSDIGTVNVPKLEFKLPRAIQFYYGSLLGERTDVQYTLTNPAFADYGVGDYYINVATGFIYKVTEKTNTTCVFDYVACIQSPLPEIEATGIDPYDDDFNPAIPEVERVFTNNELTAWKLKFKLPTAPKPAVTATFVGPDEDGSAEVEITSKDTMTFNFEIPTGSKMFSGLEVDAGNFTATVTGARPGDLYLNSNTGKIYILNKSMVWEVKEGSLKGPVGDALNIVREYKINETDTLTDSLQNGVDYITDHYKDSNGDPIPFAPDEIFAITWVSTEDSRETSYWYFYTEEGKWGRVQLTGGVMNLIETVYDPETDGPVDNKTYSVSYINKLIGGVLDLDNLDKTAFSKDQIFDMLSWGSWADAMNPSPIPEPENHDTLSAEEVIELMSWGSISKLELDAQP